MFQAAYALNGQHSIGEAEVLNWLKTRSNSDVFSGKRGALAAKFIPKELDRSKGRKGGAMPFKIWDLKNWVEDPDKFIFPFVSDGLTIILAVADWWVDLLDRSPDESRIALAEKLHEQNFALAESDYVVGLIAGVQLSKDEKASFENWAAARKEKG